MQSCAQPQFITHQINQRSLLHRICDAENKDHVDIESISSIPEHSEITYQNPSDRFPFHIRFPCDQFLAVDRDSAYDRSDQCDRSENDGANGPCPLLADPCSLYKSDDNHRTCSTEPRSDIDENPAERTQCISFLVILCQLSTQRKERNDEKRITKPETTADDQIPYKLECNTVDWHDRVHQD